jgi:SAM-dependent methyltransferase
MTTEFWDSRYREAGFAYGSEPNAWFREQLARRTPGRLFLPAEGQGRNAVFAASHGWQVEASDTSEEARRSALDLARARGVTIDYRLGDYHAWMPEPAAYDAIGLIYVHMTPDQWRVLADKMVVALKPGGVLIAEVFSKRQLGRGTGGPDDIERLYEPSQFHVTGLTTVSCQEQLVHLDEGKYHQGEASVVRALLRRE